MAHGCTRGQGIRRGLVAGHPPLAGDNLLQLVLRLRDGGLQRRAVQGRPGQGGGWRGGGAALRRFRRAKQVGALRQGLIKPLQGFIKGLALVQDIQLLPQGQRGILSSGSSLRRGRSR